MGLKDILERVRNKKALMQQVETERNVVRTLDEREKSVPEREVEHYREKARQAALAHELKAWKKMEMDQNNKMTMLNNDYYFRDNSILKSPNSIKTPTLRYPNLYGGKKK